MKSGFIFLLALWTTKALINHVETDPDPGVALVRRVVPQHAKNFIVEYIPGESDEDVFEIESRKNKIVLRGTNGVAVASGLYYYLTEVAHCQITWNGTNLNLPRTLPKVSGKIRKKSPYPYRYYLNYCTFNYSMSWWDWERWEKEIDWMALHGINMPLAITGQEYVWYEIYKRMGLSDEELRSFFSGPAYFAWFWMGNLDAWGGPLPKSWIESHKELQLKILKRQRELGMKPVLPAFTGHVPASIKRLFPDAKLKQTNWGNDFEDTYILDPDDPLFAEIAHAFITLQTEIYGTDHLYSADTFNENEPPTDDPEYLAGLSKKLYEGMKRADPKSVWVMQGWLFYSDRKFWKEEQIEALLNAVPDNGMIILDLATEIEPVWKRTHAFHGKPWIWNMLHNFGGNLSLFGRMDVVAREPALARRDNGSGKLSGIGLTMEAIEQNPVLYELMTAHTWREDPIDLDQWIPGYLLNRYGTSSDHAAKAWAVLRSTVYNGKDIRDGAESIIVARPTLQQGRRWAQTRLNYKPQDLLKAWDHLQAAIPDCRRSDGFQYDLVDVARQVLANYAMAIHGEVVSAFNEGNELELRRNSDAFLSLIDDLDMLLQTRSDFLLGTWIRDARRWGTTAEERDLYERNARNLITLWGGPTNRLHEYSNRQWSGLLKGFYKPRWQKFFVHLAASLRDKTTFDNKAFDEEIREWEWQWVNAHEAFPDETDGDAVSVSTFLYDKYRHAIEKAYHGRPTGGDK